MLKGGKVLSVFTREWLDADVAIADGRIAGVGAGYAGRQETDVRGRWLAPGYIDAHVHVESSKLAPAEFARAVLPHGTTAIVCDPHELANVLGAAGVEWLLHAARDLPLDFFVMVPSCVPASRLESPRGPLSPEEMGRLLGLQGTIGIAEMMNFPAVIAGDPGELAKLQSGPDIHVDGHAPGLTGASLNAYLAAGIESDHECTTYAEALEKRRLGMAVMIREASIARNLAALLPLALERGPQGFMFCTDDREPVFLVEEGHLDQMLRAAVAGGARAEDALTMASYEAARFHRLSHLGAIAPGYQADLVVLPDLESFRPEAVYKRGRVVEDFVAPSPPPGAERTMNLRPVSGADFEAPAGEGRVRVIGLVPGQLLTTSEEAEPAYRDGRPVADPSRDLAKIAVVERHHATGRVGVGFVTRLGLRRGALASTVAHDAHNVVVLGVDDADMAVCVNRLAELGGGIAVAAGGQILGELALPIAGLMSDRPLDEVHRRMADLERTVAGLGVATPAPFMAISFLALSVIPELKITDLGLVDVRRAELVPLFL